MNENFLKTLMNDLGVMQPEGRSGVLGQRVIEFLSMVKEKLLFLHVFLLPSLVPILRFDLAYHFENDRHLMG